LFEQRSGELSIQTKRRGLYEITAQVRTWALSSQVREGLLTLYIRHTSASLLIQENADPEVCQDMESVF